MFSRFWWITLNTTLLSGVRWRKWQRCKPLDYASKNCWHEAFSQTTVYLLLEESGYSIQWLSGPHSIKKRPEKREFLLTWYYYNYKTNFWIKLRQLALIGVSAVNVHKDNCAEEFNESVRWYSSWNEVGLADMSRLTVALVLQLLLELIHTKLSAFCCFRRFSSIASVT